jgi:UDP-N-acetylglucosamine transferase subunit ALG13
MFVTVGTDHHPFERLVAWAERWAERTDDWEVQVQHGRTRAPRAGVGFAFCDHDRLQELFAQADVVVSHGGPASISEARRFGHRPIVVPRDPARGEHVDDHQQLFVARLAHSGLVERVATEDDFLAAVVATSYLPRQRTAGDEVPPGVFQVGRIAEQLVGQRRARQVPGRRGRAEGAQRTGVS